VLLDEQSSRREHPAVVVDAFLNAVLRRPNSPSSARSTEHPLIGQIRALLEHASIRAAVT
jgi:hypothetical protein